MKKYYVNKGYKFTKYGDEFICDFEDIPHSSEKIITCRCDYCNKEYQQQVKKYYVHHKNSDKDACNDCRIIKSMEVLKSKHGGIYPINSESSMQKAKMINIQSKNDVWNKFQQLCIEKDYEIQPTAYFNNKTKIPYVCKKHRSEGIQYIDWIHLKTGRGCVKCASENRSNKQKFSYEYVKNLIESNGENILVSDKYTNYKTYDLEIKCSCGKTFVTSLAYFKTGKTKCDDCTCSVGELNIKNYLLSHNIEFEQEKEIYIKNHNMPFRLDFYIARYNLAIEFDGEQHYKPIKFKNIDNKDLYESYEYGIKRDKLKNDYCKIHTIKLWRIPYWHRDNIENIMDDLFNNHINDLFYQCG